jgi:signal transduction histidine kinase
VLEASTGLSEVQREHLRTIISSGEDLLELMNNILDHSRLESDPITLERVPFNLRDVVEGVLDTVAASAQKKGVEVCLLNLFTSDPPGMIGDPFRIKQVLINLLSNAVKFTPRGSVTVSWRSEPAPDDRISVVLEVEDTGIGIPAKSKNIITTSG